MSSQCDQCSAMSYPQNGSIANGSRRSSPTVPSAAAVRSDDTVAPMNTPSAHVGAWPTSGTFVEPSAAEHDGASIGTLASRSAASDGQRSSARPRP